MKNAWLLYLKTKRNYLPGKVDLQSSLLTEKDLRLADEGLEDVKSNQPECQAREILQVQT